MGKSGYAIEPIGIVRLDLIDREVAPRQGHKEAPDNWLEVNPNLAEGLERITVGDEILVITWLHQARRDILKVHRRRDRELPLTDIFATRSPDRPNPLGLHRVTVLEIVGNRLKVGRIEAIDGTPVVDIKPVLPKSPES